MRLTPEARNHIVNTIQSMDGAAEVYLFGSRVDDAGKGGDIDLLVLSKTLGFHDLWRMRRSILDFIGWQKLDIVIRDPAMKGKHTDALTTLALEEGLRL